MRILVTILAALAGCILLVVLLAAIFGPHFRSVDEKIEEIYRKESRKRTLE